MRGHEARGIYEIRDHRVGRYRRGDNGMLKLFKELEEGVCLLARLSLSHPLLTDLEPLFQAPHPGWGPC